jgi:hypothetical protein
MKNPDKSVQTIDFAELKDATVVNCEFKDTRKIRANNDIKVDSNGKEILDDEGNKQFINPQHSFPFTVKFDGVKLSHIVKLAASPEIITEQNKVRPKGAKWLKDNAGSEIVIEVTERGTRSNANRIDKTATNLRSMNDEELQAVSVQLDDKGIANLEAILAAARKQAKIDKA